MKKYLFIFVIILFSCSNENKEQAVTLTKNDSTEILKNKKVIPDSSRTDTANLKPMTITPEQEKDLQELLKHSAVISLRYALNDFLAGKTSSQYFEKTALEFSVPNEKTISGLKYFDKNYYKCRFATLSIDANPMGGIIIEIIFSSMPDKVFSCWMYNIAGTDKKSKENYVLRTFEESKAISKAEIGRLNKLFSKYFNDPKYSI